VPHRGRAQPRAHGRGHRLPIGESGRGGRPGQPRQDRDAAKPLLWNLRRAFPPVKLAWADGGYAGKLVTWATATLKPRLTLQIVKRPDDLHTFQVRPRRWVVERTLAWITRCRRTVRDSTSACLSTTKPSSTGR
jgi:transposase